MGVAIFTSSNCGRGVGGVTQLAASLVALFHFKATFGEWDAVLSSDDTRWQSNGCHQALSDFRKEFLNVFGEKLRFVSVRTRDIDVLNSIAHTFGRESDHSRGHWPAEAYAHLASSPILSELGYDVAVYADPDVFFLDDTLKNEIGNVKDIGCISAIPAELLVSRRPERPSRVLKDLYDEYRLITNHTLLSRVKENAALYGTTFAIKNSTNSGVVVYNTASLTSKRWNDWLSDLFAVSSKGFYGDQTALTAAYGREDVDVYWLHPKFNVGLSFPTEIVKMTCGRDVTYAKNAALLVQVGEEGVNATCENVSAVHFLWGPKPWTLQMNERHFATRKQKVAIKADLPYANMYRDAVRSLVSREILERYFKSGSFEKLNKTHVHLHRAPFGFCEESKRQRVSAGTKKNFAE